MQQWLIFFFQGVIETAQKSIHTFQEIVKLRDEIELNKLLKLGRKQIDAKKLINALYRDPIMDGAQIAETLEVHSSTANRLIKDFEALGILREFTGYKRNRIYIFEPYVKLF